MLEVIDTCPIEKTGTEVRFLPDDTMFEETVYDYDVLAQQDSARPHF